MKRRRVRRAASAGILPGMAHRIPTATFERIDHEPRDWSSDAVTEWRFRVPHRRLAGMSVRQRADLTIGLMLLRAARMPDAFFHGHPAAGEDIISQRDRAEIVATLTRIHDLPELGDDGP